MFIGKRLLVAEDIEINREILKNMLQGTGLTIDFARNGIDALIMYEDNPQKYDLFITDISMPEMNGYEAAQKIREYENKLIENACEQGNSYKRIAIIAMTANVSSVDIDKCFASGMNDHLGKPVELQELLKKLEKYLKPKS